MLAGAGVWCQLRTKPDIVMVTGMRRNLRVFGTAVAVVAATLGANPAWAQKHGGILKLYTLDSPASMSILEETTVFAQRPVMGVFNNLVIVRLELDEFEWTGADRMLPHLRRRYVTGIDRREPAGEQHQKRRLRSLEVEDAS